MKKTIVVIILAVYIASIAVVNFFGLEVKPADGSKVYISAIQCDTVTFHGDNSRVLYPAQYAGKDGNIPVFVFDFIPAPAGSSYMADNLDTNPNVVEINYEILPHTSDEVGIKFEYDEDAGVAVFHEMSGSFVFLKSDITLTITIRATDSSNVSTQVRIKGRTASAEGGSLEY